MKYKVIEEHKCNNRNPIKVKKGEKVRLDRYSNEEDGWSNWIYCFSLDSNTEGWTPEQIIKINNEYGIALCDYDATELDITSHEIVNGEIELNGWIWCCKSNNSDFGWLPKEKLIQITNMNSEVCNES